MLFAFVQLLAGCRQPVAEKAVITEGSAYFPELSTEKIYRLDGKWDFYWEALKENLQEEQAVLMPVPGTWNGLQIQNETAGRKGYATYRLKVHNLHPGRLYALYLPSAGTNLRFWVDEQLLFEAGKPAISEAGTTESYRTGLVRFTPLATTATFYAEISNFNYRKGGLWESPIFGEPLAIEQYVIGNYMLTFILLGIFVIMAFYHLIFFVLDRSNLGSLYFSLFCTVMWLRISSSGVYGIYRIVDLPWYVVIRFELFGYYASILLLALFIETIFKKINPILLKTVKLTSAAFCISVLVLPIYYSSFTVNLHHAYVVTIAFYGLYLPFKHYKKDRAQAVAWFIGIFFTLLTGLHDIFLSTDAYSSTPLYPFGLLILVASQAFLLANKYIKNFRIVDSLLSRTSQQNLELQRTSTDTNKSLTKAFGSLIEKNEEIERSNSQLNKVTENLNKLLYRVTHDIRSPLLSALGLIQLMENARDAEELKDFMKMQRTSLNKLDRLVQNIALYHKSKEELTITELSIAELIDSTIQQYTVLPEHADVVVKKIIKERHKLYTDSLRIEAIVDNLIGNAFKYKNKYAQPPEVFIKAEVTAKKLRLTITDNGIGIVQKYQKSVFKLFSRATDQASGSGLGLYLVHESVQKLKGSIHFESISGKGSTFFISLPNSPTLVQQPQPVNLPH
jgi:signal transduction histidine kinase